jgi:integrase
MINKQNSLCPEFWDWLPKAYRDGDIGDEPRFTKYNMEVAFLAGNQLFEQQPENEPVAWIIWTFGPVRAFLKKDEAMVEYERLNIQYPEPARKLLSLYTTPPQRKPLTDEEIEDVWASCEVDWDDKVNVLTLARAIEAAHGIKGEA